MKERLVVGLLTPRSLDDAASAVRFLELLTRTAPDLSPEFYGNFEPVATPFHAIEAVVASWKPPFLWKRRTGAKADGAVWFGNPGNHSAMYVRAKAGRQPEEQAVTLVQAGATALSADFAYVHLLTGVETKSPRVSYDMWYPIDIGVTSHDLRKGIPNVCWAMVLGPPYVRMIGRDRLLSTPCFGSKALSDEHVYLQVTATIEDLRRDFEGFEELRQRLKEEIGEEVFARVELGSASAVPDFEL